MIETTVDNFFIGTLLHFGVVLAYPRIHVNPAVLSYMALPHTHIFIVGLIPYNATDTSNRMKRMFCLSSPARRPDRGKQDERPGDGDQR